MRIYHGSEFSVEKPEYGKGKANNDYGRGFYCTREIDLAREWAVEEDRDGYVNTYDLDENGLKILHLNSDAYCILHWITILLKNRRFELEAPLAKEAYRYLTEHFSVDLSGVDVITGYRADDSYFSYAQDFVSGQISVSQLSKAMRLGMLGEQIVLLSRKAFSKLSFVGAEPVSAAEWFVRKKRRDTQAREAYFRMNKDGYIRGDLYMVHIIDGEVKSNDPRLF